jgi:hypothetical protein
MPHAEPSTESPEKFWETKRAEGVLMTILSRRSQEAMSTAHVSSLAAKHAEIEARLTDEQRRPRPDEVLVAMLKKQKLRLKEALASN